MASPSTKSELISYAKRRLGAPVIEINVDDDQVDDRIDEAVQYFNEFHYDGSLRTYLKLQLSQAIQDGLITNTDDVVGGNTFQEQNNYIQMPEYVLSVLRIFPFRDQNTTNMFDLRYQIRLNDVPSLTNTNIMYYAQVNQYITMLDEMLQGQTPIRYNMHQNRLYLDMDFSQVSADEYIIIECYRKLDPTTYTDIYNDMWLKKYATALIKHQWGENLSKFQGMQLPGGVTLDASTIKQEALDEIRRLEEESRLNFEMPVADMIG